MRVVGAQLSIRFVLGARCLQGTEGGGLTGGGGDVGPGRTSENIPCGPRCSVGL